MLKTRRPVHAVVTIIRLLGIALFALPVLLLPHVAAGQTVVGGQNNPAVDVPAVQAAVDQGGCALLGRTVESWDARRGLPRQRADNIARSGIPRTSPVSHEPR